MTAPAEPLSPPRVALGALGWLRQNLFNTWLNTLLTLGALWLLYSLLRPALAWVFRAAEWGVIAANVRVFAVGQYPAEAFWRVWASLWLLALLAGISWGVWGAGGRAFAVSIASAGLLLAALPFGLAVRAQLLGLALGVALGLLVARNRTGWRRWLILAWVLFFPLVIVLVRGGQNLPLLPPVETNLWGGLLLTFLLAIVGIVFSFPLGVLLALGRRSQLPVMRLFSTLYIELIRGVPLVTVLFMAQIMLPLFLPAEIRVDRVARAMIGFVMFIAAYVAEDVRGGLAAVGRGQYEAAQALGLNGALTMGLVILPQALRAIIPSLVGHFISLFKDTSLVAIVGLLDFLNIGRSVLAQPEWLGLQREVYVFAAVVYWVFSFAMSSAARRLEKTLGVGTR